MIQARCREVRRLNQLLFFAHIFKILNRLIAWRIQLKAVLCSVDYDVAFLLCSENKPEAMMSCVRLVIPGKVFGNHQ